MNFDLILCRMQVPPFLHGFGLHCEDAVKVENRERLVTLPDAPQALTHLHENPGKPLFSLKSKFLSALAKCLSPWGILLVTEPPCCTHGENHPIPLQPSQPGQG